MSGQPSGSGDAPSSSVLPPKAIGSLAKKQADVTRQGTQKLKFVPTLPARRKKDVEVKPEPAAPVLPAAERGRGRGRGRGDARGRGRGARPAVEMTASGPFAMGPALAGNNARRVAPRSNFAIAPTGPGASALGAGLSRTAAPSLKQEVGGKPPSNDDEDTYSDPDEGVQIVDMQDVRGMDWMAPETLRKERKPDKKKGVVKKEDPTRSPDLQGKGKARDTGPADVEEAAAPGEVDLANALDLSESEEEEEMEDLMDDFAVDAILDEDPDIRQERLYFFQFPSPFPTFVSKTAPSVPMDVDTPDPAPKKVSFAPDVKPPAPGSSRTSAAPEAEPTPPAKVEGRIGQLEIYRSGAVKMRLANGIVLDVAAATQPSFLQQAVHLDMEHKRLTVLGEVNKRFVVSPNVEALLSAMEVADSTALGLDGEDGLIKMD